MLAARLEPKKKVMPNELAYAAVWTEGENLTLEQAVDDAFAELAASEADGATNAEPSSLPSKEVRDLTAREHEAVVLIAAGYSNRMIAAELVVGIKTVEAHVSHILTKLGFSSRLKSPPGQ